MKKIIAIVILVATLCCALVGCSKVDPNLKSEGVMTYAEYNAAALKSTVTIEGFIQAKQAYAEAYKNTCLYLQDGEGAYFVYRIGCTQEQYDTFKVGSKIKIVGTKDAWGGEVEIVDITAFEIVGTDTWIAKATDVTSIIHDNAELKKHENKFAVVKDMTVVSVVFQNDVAGDNNDIYLTLSKKDADGVDKTYEFCVEEALVDFQTAEYKAVSELKAGDVVDVEGFLYWYEDAINTHVTKVTVK